MVRLNTSSSPAQLRKLPPRSRARWMSSGVIDVSPCEARPSRQTGLPNAEAGRRRKASFMSVARGNHLPDAADKVELPPEELEQAVDAEPHADEERDRAEAPQGH